VKEKSVYPNIIQGQQNFGNSVGIFPGKVCNLQIPHSNLEILSVE
jgi:hypothetical protein